ncbi:hypothetical protein O6H91_13G103900 [Diphasiastrum complanatum]|uniref:Uncharacterized protein n=1 Tax=Diphasiastrum complanatum TaxID=34168 RepID=A0ACC2BY22_DIPCM|nr:hypothetical protein O6H91_13G103900 [Diphasiastrum complanatum]
MGRGVSSGGGSSSLGYLFGSNEQPKPAEVPRAAPVQHEVQPLQNQPAAAGLSRNNNAPGSATAVIKPEDSGASSETGAPSLGRSNNNYHRAEGQNTGNFITDRPSTKVHAAPGGGSSLGYLFGGGERG